MPNVTFRIGSPAPLFANYDLTLPVNCGFCHTYVCMYVHIGESSKVQNTKHASLVIWLKSLPAVQVSIHHNG